MVNYIVFLMAITIGATSGIITFLLFMLIGIFSSHPPDTATYIIFSLGSLVIGGVITIFAGTEILYAKTVTLEKGDFIVDDGKLIEVERDITLWKKDRRVSERLIIDNGKFKLPRAWMLLSPITDGTRVRNIGYEIYVFVDDRQKFYDFFLKNSNSPEPESFVKSICYEFNEIFSSELGRLFNPMDETQQKNFSEMIDSFLSPILDEQNTGLKIGRTEFNLQAS